MKLPHALIVLALLAAYPAEAHTLAGAADTAFAGLVHPLNGIDHILAMLAVGIWAAQQGRPALLFLPLAFPAVMAVGAFLGAAGMPLPSVEAGIAASVLILGVAIVLALRPSPAIGAALVSLFALFHGHAHGAELPVTGSPLAYGLGFVAATLALHLAGIGIGQFHRLNHGAVMLRAAGSVIAIAGIALLAPVAFRF